MMIWQKLCYRILERLSYLDWILRRKPSLLLRGSKIGKSSVDSFKITWPHQLSIGDQCRIEHDVFFKFDGEWKPGPNIIIKDDIFIGNNCEFNISHGIIINSYALIASGCQFIDHNHGISEPNTPYKNQHCAGEKIEIGENVWIGCNSIVLTGVKIGNNSVIGAGSVVNKNVPENEVWAGVPAKCIRKVHS